MDSADGQRQPGYRRRSLDSVDSVDSVDSRETARGCLFFALIRGRQFHWICRRSSDRIEIANDAPYI